MTIEIPKCFQCKNTISIYEVPPKCRAFPDGIPDEIYWGENDHSKPLPDQDNDIVFEPIDE